MAKLDRIRIAGYKSIAKADVELNALNVLIGANGSGKTNFISMFKLLNEMLNERLQVFSGKVGANSLFHYGTKVTSEIEVELEFGANGYEAIFVPSRNDTLIFSQEAYSFHDRARYPSPAWYVIGRGHQETNLYGISESRPYRTPADYVLDSLKSWKIYHFHDTSDTALLKQTVSIDDNESLRPDASNLAAFLYLLQERYPTHYANIIGMVRQIAPFFDDFVLRPSPLNPDNIRLEWRERGSDDYFNAHMLSDGTLRFICLATLLLQPELPTTILIDEPELGLHPFAITQIAGLLESAATQTQVIVATQSVPLINQFSPEDILVVEREQGKSVFKRLDVETLATWLEEYGLGELWEKNVLGGRPQP